jgi:hypothetical protein
VGIGKVELGIAGVMEVKMMRCITGWTILVIGLLVSAGVVQAQELEDNPVVEPPQYWFDHVHVSVAGGPSPFLAVNYTVRVIGDVAVAIQTKQYPQVPVYDNRVAVVPITEAKKLFRKLDELGGLDLLDAVAQAPMALEYEVEFAWAGRVNRFRVRGGDLLEDLRYAQAVDAVEAFVEAHTGVAYFRDVMVPEKELGLLNLRTFPLVEVTVDGLPLGRTTPVFGLEMKAGTHTAALYSPDLNITRRIKFSIYKGEVTNLNLNIKQ